MVGARLCVSAGDARRYFVHLDVLWLNVDNWQVEMRMCFLCTWFRECTKENKQSDSWLSLCQEIHHFPLTNSSILESEQANDFLSFPFPHTFWDHYRVEGDHLVISASMHLSNLYPISSILLNAFIRIFLAPFRACQSFSVYLALCQ